MLPDVAECLAVRYKKSDLRRHLYFTFTVTVSFLLLSPEWGLLREAIYSRIKP
jgi:hypothetical protein